MIVESLSRGMLSYITSRDQNLMRRLNGWKPPRWIRIWMVLASRVGDGWLWYALGIVLMIFGGPQRFVAVGAATNDDRLVSFSPANGSITILETDGKRLHLIEKGQEADTVVR